MRAANSVNTILTLYLFIRVDEEICRQSAVYDLNQFKPIMSKTNLQNVNTATGQHSAERASIVHRSI